MSGSTRKILILGGYGVFGGCLAQLLATDARVSLVIAGRSLDKARAFCATLPEGAGRVAAAFDRDGDVASQLATIKPDVVVDASGPFQAYSGDIYKLVRSSIDVGADYMDLADASDFVAEIGAFDEAARATGVYVLSGVSSFPVLTAAVVRELARGLARLDTVRAGIAPSPFARVGPNVIRAVASYAGQKVTLTRGGASAYGYGLTETMRRAVRPPGMLPLASRLFSLVDVPDLRALPPLWPGLRSIWIGAAPVPEVLHRALLALSWLVRWRLLPNLTPLAPLFHAALTSLHWGPQRGGMFVEIRGIDRTGAASRRSWHMLAEGDDGPLIPSMAIAAILRNEFDGRRPAAGARAATGELELADYDAIFRPFAIRHGIRNDSALASASLYQRMLASAWDELPDALRIMHTVAPVRRAQGEADIERGSGLFALFLAAVFGFPKAGRHAPTSVCFEAKDGVETWTRSFAGRTMRSRQWEGAGRWEGLLCEGFGPFTFGLAALTGDRTLRLVVRRWAMLGIPLPMALAPRGHAIETEKDGRFHFDVEIAAPLIGTIVRYRGWLAPG
jgi:Domain of unknown function (DUF4166)/Saccharopine dehydrogenase NADP binding domain